MGYWNHRPQDDLRTGVGPDPWARVQHLEVSVVMICINVPSNIDYTQGNGVDL